MVSSVSYHPSPLELARALSCSRIFVEFFLKLEYFTMIWENVQVTGKCISKSKN